MNSITFAPHVSPLLVHFYRRHTACAINSATAIANRIFTLLQKANSLGIMPPVKYWEMIADRLHAEGWSYGIAEHLTKRGLLYCVDAHRDGKRFIVKANDLLTAFLSLESDAIAAKGANGNATRQNVA